MFRRNRRSQRGQDNNHSKLTNEDVIEIKKLLTGSTLQKEIATIFGVYPSTISAIKRGILWKHV